MRVVAREGGGARPRRTSRRTWSPGCSRTGTGRYDQAIEHLTRVVERAPGYARAQYQLAIAYQRSGNAEKAREHQEIYNRLIQEQKARTIGVRGEVR